MVKAVSLADLTDFNPEIWDQLCAARTESVMVLLSFLMWLKQELMAVYESVFSCFCSIQVENQGQSNKHVSRQISQK